MSTILAALAVQQDAAQRAYGEGDWIRAARAWLTIATTAPDRFVASRAFHQAARCHAHALDLDQAFAVLGRALSAHPVPLEDLENDSDLVTLRTDARWPLLMTRAADAFAAWEATIGQPALRRELLRLRDEDQAVRGKQPPPREGLSTVDRRTATRLREIIAAHGWPGISLVGHDGGAAAWLIAQHATHDPDFQENCLAALREAAARGEAEPRQVAFLEDRLAVLAGRPQRYGTQFTPANEPYPIEDVEDVDDRRHAVGLVSLATYAEQVRKWFSD
ncbi:MAG: hypothetical protein JWN44_5841 [Myxococcales bacterium]|nr:hypothetical protein [Myxococcales bacterium]